MNELALFAGAGGGILAAELRGDRVICAVERDAYCAQVLAQRQNDGILRPFPIWTGIESFDGQPWRGIIDSISGGFPCTDISCGKQHAEGIAGPESGLWKQYKRIIREVGPRIVRVENSPMLTSRGLGVVLADLAELGFDAEWGVLGASDFDADHERKRIWIVAYADSPRLQGWSCAEIQGWRFATGYAWACNRWPSEPGIQRISNGVAYRVDRLKAIGNGQVPRVEAAASEILSCRARPQVGSSINA